MAHRVTAQSRVGVERRQRGAERMSSHNWQSDVLAEFALGTAAGHYSHSRTFPADGGCLAARLGHWNGAHDLDRCGNATHSHTCGAAYLSSAQPQGRIYPRRRTSQSPSSAFARADHALHHVKEHGRKAKSRSSKASCATGSSWKRISSATPTVMDAFVFHAGCQSNVLRWRWRRLRQSNHPISFAATVPTLDLSSASQLLPAPIVRIRSPGPSTEAECPARIRGGARRSPPVPPSSAMPRRR